VTENLRHIKDAFTSESLGPDWHGDVFYSAGRNEGPVVFEQVYTGIELFWHTLLGTYTYSVDTPVAGANTHAFTHVASTNAHPKMSIEAIRGIGGTSERSYLGMYATKATVEFAPRQAVRTTFDMVGQGFSLSAATAKTFPTAALVLPAHKSTLTLGGTALSVLSGSIEIELSRADGREHYGEALYKEPVVDDRPMSNFTLECEYDDSSGVDVEQYLLDFESGTKITGLVLAHQGDIVVGATQEEFTISATHAQILEATPSTQDNGITKVSITGRLLTGISVTFINATAQVT